MALRRRLVFCATCGVTFIPHISYPAARFYYDLTLAGEQVPVKTVAAYWPLLAKVAAPGQAEALIAELGNPRTFGRLRRVPTCSGEEPRFTSAGGYWRGAVWAPTNTMVIRGLENYGSDALAREIALEHLDRVAAVFEKTGTIWESYAPDSVEPGKPAKRDFVGWSGIGPIMYLLEYAVGLRADAGRNEIFWRLTSAGRVGCERFRFNGHVVTLVAEPSRRGRRRISVESDGAFRLRVRVGNREEAFAIDKGRRQFSLK
ncbi:MAG: trehalase family glycosidase [Acidobacteria bacterium]|nr:trehalase family glycosidase [Acidobacteriota bacterium]